MAEMLIVPPAARNAIKAEARRLGIDPLDHTTERGPGTRVIDWQKVVEAIEAKRAAEAA